MTKADADALVRLDLNNPVFQENLLALQKPERHSALETLNKLRRMTWSQVYRDRGLKWEKVARVAPPAGGCRDLFAAHHAIKACDGLSGRRFHTVADHLT